MKTEDLARVDTMGSAIDSPTASENEAASTPASAYPYLVRDGSVLTPYGVDVLYDALVTAESEAEREAENWKGRSREAQYRREAAELVEIQSLIEGMVAKVALHDELVAALKAMVDAEDNTIEAFGSLEIVTLEAAMRVARAAIAKAEGR